MNVNPDKEKTKLVESSINSIFDYIHCYGVTDKAFREACYLIVFIMKNYKDLKKELVCNYVITIVSLIRKDDDDEEKEEFVMMSNEMRADLCSIF